LPVKSSIIILLYSIAILLQAHGLYGQDVKKDKQFVFDFYGDSIHITTNIAIKSNPDSNAALQEKIIQYYQEIEQTTYPTLISSLTAYRQRSRLDDWLYYQLIRKTAQQLAPKQDNYERYTVYKWFMLSKSGYAATLRASRNKLLFYVHTDEDVFNLPVYRKNGRQYVCLNYHDYAPVDFFSEKFMDVTPEVQEGIHPFSYRITQLPEFKPDAYIEKELHFTYFSTDYNVKIKLNPQVKTIFTNYPVVDYAAYFNIPLSRETYASLIPALKQNISGKTVKQGVDFLMRFTRYAFLFEPDSRQFGQEKRLSPEQTLLYDKSDCEDRAALFFFLVKEIYNLPMIVLSYPEHISIGIHFEKPEGRPVYYNGMAYTICEPTPQKKDLALGRAPASVKNAPYKVVYVYNPVN
jgi:hypothetical protein